MRLSTKSKYRDVAMGIIELLWIKILLRDIGLEVEGIMGLYYDNKVVINIFNNYILHDRTKHMEIDKYFIREMIDSKKFTLIYHNSKSNG